MHALYSVEATSKKEHILHIWSFASFLSHLIFIFCIGARRRSLGRLRRRRCCPAWGGKHAAVPTATVPFQSVAARLPVGECSILSTLPKLYLRGVLCAASFPIRKTKQSLELWDGSLCRMQVECNV